MKRVMVLNRGEIANRIISSIKSMGLLAIAVYSDPDRNSLAVKSADLSYPLGGESSTESYLNLEKIREAIQATKADAVHPGYGFLSERSDLIELCDELDVVFIGPGKEAILKMGDKIESKQLMEKGGVPVVPGFFMDGLTPEKIVEKVEEIGLPVMVKAAAGGGGKGMRKVDQLKDLQSDIESCQREAKNSFGDERIFIEKYIENPRHIEIQVFGDSHGNIMHLNERECSIQRRNQKIVEEAPSCVLSSQKREEMGKAAILAAQLVSYQSAGTVEFIYTPEDEFYFLEMNTRLQVEHPVTEESLGVDLVQEQIRVARGEELSFQDLVPEAHSMECRLYAEAPLENYQPSCGKILKLVWPRSKDWLRIDKGVEEGDEVTPFYDPMIAKVITKGKTRVQAIERMIQALEELVLFGVTTNQGFLLHLLRQPAFQEGRLSTHFLDQHGVLDGYRNRLASAQDEGLATGLAGCFLASRTSGSLHNSPYSIQGLNAGKKEQS